MTEAGVVPVPPSMPILFLSAGLAGCAAEVTTFPMDLAKVRLQVQGEAHNRVGQLDRGKAIKPPYKGMLHVWKVIATEEGPRACYKGLIPALHRQIVFCSVRVGLYDVIKTELMAAVYGRDNKKAGVTIPLRILSGITTGTIAICCAQPTDVVKIRMQASSGAAAPSRTVGTLAAYTNIAKREGVRGLWKGLGPNIVRNSIVNTTELVTYDLAKEKILQYGLMKDGFPCHFVSGFISGFVTTIVGSPVDVIKTRYMNSPPGIYKGPVDCCYRTFREGGFLAFYKGFIPSVIRLSSFAICMFVSFEQLKGLLTRLTQPSSTPHIDTSLFNKPHGWISEDNVVSPRSIHTSKYIKHHHIGAPWEMQCLQSHDESYLDLGDKYQYMRTVTGNNKGVNTKWS